MSDKTDSILKEILSGEMKFTKECPQWINIDYGKQRMHIADVRGWGHLISSNYCGLDSDDAITVHDGMAKEIIKRWNMHDELVEALVSAKHEIKGREHTGWIDEILKKAKGSDGV